MGVTPGNGLEETSSIPGLAFGCEPTEAPFQQWEKTERKGALKSMFFWKGKLQQHARTTKEERKNGQDKNKKAEESVEKSANSAQTSSESIDHTIYKLLTRRTGKRSNPKKKKACEKETWRGPREQQSELPVPRRGPKNRDQVKGKV